MNASRTKDIEVILERRHHRGGDFWASPEGKVYVGNPFSTIGSLLMLHELEVGGDHEAVAGGLELILAAGRDDGKIKLGPTSPLYPCYTAEAARTLCRFGLTDHEQLRWTVGYFVREVHESGGWRCNFKRFGTGPETRVANPGATLYVLDVLRFFERFRSGHRVADGAVEFLLDHWETREPLGPCHWGIGSTFLQVEFPFLKYNLFYWVYVLSFFERARTDARFLAALEVLEAAIDEEGRMVVQNRHRNLGTLDFCRKGEASAPATRRYREIRANLAENGA